MSITLSKKPGFANLFIPFISSSSHARSSCHAAISSTAEKTSTNSPPETSTGCIYGFVIASTISQTSACQRALSVRTPSISSSHNISSFFTGICPFLIFILHPLWTYVNNFEQKKARFPGLIYFFYFCPCPFPALFLFPCPVREPNRGSPSRNASRN